MVKQSALTIMHPMDKAVAEYGLMININCVGNESTIVDCSYIEDGEIILVTIVKLLV